MASLICGCRQTARATQEPPASNPIHAGSFRAPGLSDRQVLTLAFAAWIRRGSGVLELERDHVYDLGVQRDGSNVFVVFGLRNAVLAGNGATLRINSQVNAPFNLLYLARYAGLRIENLNCLDTGYRGSYNAGAKFIVLDAAVNDSVDLTLDNVAGEGLVSFIHVQASPNGPRVRGIRIMPNCRATRVFYALNCVDSGDDVSGGFSTFNCARSYFPYGVQRHNLRIRIDHRGPRFGPTAEAAVLIKSYGRPTRDIRVDLTFSGVLAANGACVALEHQHDRASASVIEDVDIRIVIAPGTQDPFNIARLALRSFRPDATLETGSTRNVWRRIRVSGDLGPGRSPAISSRSLPAEVGEITIARGTVGAEGGNILAPGFRIRREN